MSWPFKYTPAEAFYPDRREEIQRFWQTLQGYACNHLWRFQIEPDALKAESLYDLCYHHRRIVLDFLNTRAYGQHTISMHALDFLAAMLKDDVPEEPARLLLATMAVVLHNGDLLLKEDLNDLGLTCILQRLSFTPGTELTQYALPLLKFISRRCEFESRYSLLALTSTVSPTQKNLPEAEQLINLHLLLDEPVVKEQTYFHGGFYASDFPGYGRRHFEEDVLTRKVATDRRETFPNLEAWREAYGQALKCFLKDNVSDNTDQRATDDVDKLLLILVYNPGIYDRISGVTPEQIMERLGPIVEMILALTYDDAELRAMFKRQVFVNLFSTFPEDLKSLGVTTQDLMGLAAEPLARLDRMWSMNFSHGPLGYSYSYTADITAVFKNRLEAFYGEISMVDLLCSGFAESEAFDHVFESDRHWSAIGPAVLSGKMTEEGKDQIWPEIYSDPNRFDRDICLELYVNRMRLFEFSREVPKNQLIKDFQGFFLRRPDLRMEAIGRMLKRYPEIFRVIDNRMISPLLNMMLFSDRDLHALGNQVPEAVRSSMLSDDLGL